MLWVFDKGTIRGQILLPAMLALRLIYNINTSYNNIKELPLIKGPISKLINKKIYLYGSENQPLQFYLKIILHSNKIIVRY